MHHVTRLTRLSVALLLALAVPVRALAGLSNEDRPDPLAPVTAETECDRIAASPYDPDRVMSVPGVEYNLLDLAPARRACDEAMAQNPETARFIYQAGRVALAQEDTARAIGLYRRAADMGYTSAMVGLCILYNEGLGVTPDAELGNSWCQRSADLGNAAAQAYSGFYTRRPEQLEQSAAAGSPIGMMLLASYLGATNGDPRRITDLLQRAADANFPTALTAVGDSHRIGDNGFSSDTTLWVSMVTRAANLGEPAAALELGKAYLDAEIVSRDYDKARQFYERAAQSHKLDATKDAMRALGKMYEEGLGVETNIQRSREWYAKAYDFKPNDSIIAYMMP